jgi:Skp family chaperone for outer membrane proteins
MRRVSIGLLVALAACAHSTASQSPTPRPFGQPARLDLRRAVAGHPLASMLREYDANLATLRLIQTPAGLTNLSERIAADVTDAHDVLDAAARQTSALQIRIPSIPTTGTPPDSGEAAVATYRDALQLRNDRALTLRASQLRESEANAAYAFDRTHAGTRLQIRVKLRNLHLEPQERRRMQAELDALQSQEDRLVAGIRSQDAITLSGFAQSLQREAISNLNELAGDVEEHRRTAAQLRDDVRTPAAALTHDDRALALQAYKTSGADITQRLNDVASQNRLAAARLASEIASVQKARAALRSEIVASIETTANSVAGERGLGRVYESNAPSGATDITSDVVSHGRSTMQ